MELACGWTVLEKGPRWLLQTASWQFESFRLKVLVYILPFRNIRYTEAEYFDISADNEDLFRKL